MSRAFKPMPIILDLVQKIFGNIKILFYSWAKVGERF